MKLVALVALALLPIALGTPASDDGKPGNNAAVQAASTSQWRVTADALKCRTGPNTGSTPVRQYPLGTIITATCWTDGETINGNVWWDKTTDGCYCSEAYLQYVSGSYSKCP